MTAPDPGGSVPAQPGDEVCVLVSASCTIAWVDLAHGALWLCPSGLLRVPLDPAAASNQGTGPTVDPNLPWEATFTQAQFADAARLGGGFRWYPRGAIAGMRFEPGQTTNALQLMLQDGSHVELQWRAVDRGADLIEEWAAGNASG